PEKANPNQSDIDGDGIGDVCDVPAVRVTGLIGPSTALLGGPPAKYAFRLLNTRPDDLPSVYTVSIKDPLGAVSLVTTMSMTLPAGSFTPITVDVSFPMAGPPGLWTVIFEVVLVGDPNLHRVLKTVMAR